MMDTRDYSWTRHVQLLRFSFWLLLQADALDTRRWSLLHLRKIQVGFFGNDTRMLWAILHYARDQDQDAVLPQICFNQAGDVLAKAPFEAQFNTARQKEILCESLLNIDCVQRRRWRYSGELPGAAIRFAHYIRTDGFTANVLFERPQSRNCHVCTLCMITLYLMLILFLQPFFFRKSQRQLVEM
ncbi:hypothetical protein K492DRAFT_60213 [Lichtheimia hyalospora FSU 10163]|nr:hypothetical protein K492DRAFT_60213 [Lichtheimia hyalospora FSU 10163]